MKPAERPRRMDKLYQSCRLLLVDATNLFDELLDAGVVAHVAVAALASTLMLSYFEADTYERFHSVSVEEAYEERIGFLPNHLGQPNLNPIQFVGTVP